MPLKQSAWLFSHPNPKYVCNAFEAFGMSKRLALNAEYFAFYSKLTRKMLSHFGGDERGGNVVICGFQSV